MEEDKEDSSLRAKLVKDVITDYSNKICLLSMYKSGLEEYMQNLSFNTSISSLKIIENNKINGNISFIEDDGTIKVVNFTTWSKI